MIPERTALLAAAAMVLLAALAASPAAARDVAAGSTIFVGEENLNLTAMNGTPVATLVYYSTAAPATIGRTISVGDSGAFDLTAADVGTSVGMWYAFPAGAALEDPDAANGYVIVQAPDIEPDTEVAGTVSAGTLDIAANKDSVFRGNNFVVTVTGEPSTAYYLYVEDPGLPANECPWIPVGQVGVQLTNVIGGSPSQANVTTNAAGAATSSSTPTRALPTGLIPSMSRAGLIRAPTTRSRFASRRVRSPLRYPAPVSTTSARRSSSPARTPTAIPPTSS
jgi:hypothetical protein